MSACRPFEKPEWQFVDYLKRAVMLFYRSLEKETIQRMFLYNFRQLWLIPETALKMTEKLAIFHRLHYIIGVKIRA